MAKQTPSPSTQKHQAGLEAATHRIRGRATRVRKPSERGILYAQVRQQQKHDNAQRQLARRRHSSERYRRVDRQQRARGDGSSDEDAPRQKQQQHHYHNQRQNDQQPRSQPAKQVDAEQEPPKATPSVKRVWVCDAEGRRRCLTNEDLRAALVMCTLPLHRCGMFDPETYRQVLEQSRPIVAGWWVERVEWAYDGDSDADDDETIDDDDETIDDDDATVVEEEM